MCGMFELGADVAINYRTQDFVEVMKEQGLAADLVLDMVGGDYVRAISKSWPWKVALCKSHFSKDQN